MRNSNNLTVLAPSQHKPRLPDLPSPKIQNVKSLADQIYELKLQTRQMENETRQLKSKTVFTKRTLKSREKQIDNVGNQNSENAQIKTAAVNTLRNLRDNIIVLENFLQSKKDELEKIRKSDQLAHAKELEIEVRMLHLEKKRLLEREKSRKDDEAIILGELNRLQNQTSMAPEYEQNINQIQIEIDNLTDKLFAYTKSQSRMNSTKRMKFISDNPSMLETVKEQSRDELVRCQNKIERNKKILEHIKQHEEKNIAYLQDVIDKLANEIQNALHEL